MAIQTTRSVATAGLPSSRAWTDPVPLAQPRRHLRPSCSLSPGDGMNAIVSAAGHGTPEFQQALAAKGARPPVVVEDGRKAPTPSSRRWVSLVLGESCWLTLTAETRGQACGDMPGPTSRCESPPPPRQAMQHPPDCCGLHEFDAS